MTSPLAGITVVSFEQAVAAPYYHPQLTARQRWQQVDPPAGPLASLLPPFVSEQWPVPLCAVPALGQHTGAILTELGLSGQEQDALKEAGAV